MLSWWPAFGGAVSKVEEGKGNSQERICFPTSEPHQYSMIWRDHGAWTMGALEWSQWWFPLKPGDGFIPHVIDQLEGGWDPHCTWRVVGRRVSPLLTELGRWSWLLRRAWTGTQTLGGSKDYYDSERLHISHNWLYHTHHRSRRTDCACGDYMPTSTAVQTQAVGPRMKGRLGQLAWVRGLVLQCWESLGVEGVKSWKFFGIP